ncbi:MULTISPECIES: transcriptional regulator AhrC/ArgR [Carnobacterium]|uniref:Arginine repressor n=2 Tax=Carnobacterium divergens TaxID=2748 RepID=A0A0R2HPB3_CARDV|nr:MULTISPECIES: transcriptional regulator ArgR [Carnobacterium]AOA00336.1 arginine repressor [Carnobacterium divergens]KRN54723.1 arginine catabolic regulator [Carnobacterium divergens DSM 20623]MCO6017311.1 transcriptional regulator ArgR [Carnobacterium divergens]MDO0874210.1 transcriptional regulator ArgR [Carnobacterium divergens]MDT1939274.1 transcriptional regulator ArgR [Carnobacterium divergens]
MKKKERHRLLQELIQDNVIEKQEDFVRILEERGIVVTQATISRDIKELHLVKVPSQTGGYRYSMPPDAQYDTSKKLERLVKDAFVSIDMQDYFLVLKTIPGNAYALGSLIDSSSFEGVFGTICGDDTVLIICKSAEAATRIKDHFLHLL